MTRLDEILDDLDPEALSPDGLEAAVIGYTVGTQLPGLLVVDVSKAREIVGQEWLEYNTLGAYAGPGTPIYVVLLEDE